MGRWGDPCAHAALPSRTRTLLLSASSPPSLIKIQDRLLCDNTLSASKKGVIGTKLASVT